jgi:uncharacterized protein (DUF1499 family)
MRNDDEFPDPDVEDEFAYREDVPEAEAEEAEAPEPVGGVGQHSRLALAALGLAAAAASLGAAAGFGSRWGFWHFSTGFELLRYAVYGGIAAVALSAVALYWSRPGSGRRGFGFAALGLVLGAIVLWIPLQHRQARDLPPIHDITTDTDRPPAFVAVAPLRADAPNPVEYLGEEVAHLQRQAYPDIRPLVLDLSHQRAFQRALDMAEAQGWEIVSQSVIEGRIEATDRTFWFGFRDDVVIRLTPLNGRTVVDVRSKSRVGRGDLGTNARRVRDYLRAVAGE